MNSLISPALAFLYNPLGSRFSHSSTDASTNTSMKGKEGLNSACSLRAKSRSALYGEMKEAIVRADEEANKTET